jgi:hypothetical protein
VIESERREEQARDDRFRDRLLGAECFCGAKGGVAHGKMEDGTKITVERRAAPLHCLAHGYCEAHSTPIADQMSVLDKAMIAKRCGFNLNKVLG